MTGTVGKQAGHLHSEKLFSSGQEEVLNLLVPAECLQIKEIFHVHSYPVLGG